MKNNKGFGLIGWIITIAVVAALVGVIVFFLGKGGFGSGGGKGDGEGSGDETVATVDESDESKDEKVTEPVTEEMKYIEITVSGNEYLYQNSKYVLDNLIVEIKKNATDVPVKITDDKSSLKAYNSLIDALKENNIRYIKAED